MEVNSYTGLKYELGNYAEVNDSLTVEEAIQISINDDPYTVTMRTPGKDLELVRGLLYSEDIYRYEGTAFHIQTMDINTDGEITAVNVIIPKEQLGAGYIPTRNVLSVSSCGICGKRELDDIAVQGDPLNHAHQFNLALLEGMFVKMSTAQKAFNQSGGCHAAAAFTVAGKMVAVEEDIGRHNAVDKVIGSLLIKEKLDDVQCLLVSGRLSYEIVTKAFMAKFPYLASVSAPSTLAVDYAERLGITLLSFCRDGKATCYSNQKYLERD